VALSAAQAQNPPSPATTSGPLDASASVPPFVYRSTLSTYRRLGNDQPVPWREANETVGRIGGWRAYAREASEPAATESAAPAATRPSQPARPASAPSMTPMPAGHGSHKTH
jgi:hypothetical protein